MQKKSKGIILLGAFLVLLGVGLLSVLSEIFSEIYGLEQYSLRIDQAVVKTLDGLKYFDGQEQQAKLQASGNLEKLKMQADNFKQQLKSHLENFKRLVSVGLILQVMINFILGIFLLVSGFGLLGHLKWARELSLVSIVGFSLYIISLPIVSFYPKEWVRQFVENSVDKLNLLYDPTYKNSFIYAGKSGFEVMLIERGNIILSCGLISFFVGTFIWWYLTRPDVKARFV